MYLMTATFKSIPLTCMMTIMASLLHGIIASMTYMISSILHSVVLQTTIQEQLAQFAFDLVYTSHMIQAIYQALQSSASLGWSFRINPSGIMESHQIGLSCRALTGVGSSTIVLQGTCLRWCKL